MSYRELADLNIVAELPAQVHEPYRPGSQDGRRPRAVLVDDSAIMRNLLARILESTPLDIVATATSAKDALRLTKKLRPDVVIIDALIPGVGDNGILHELRQLHPSVRIILSTTRTSKLAGVRRAFPKADEYILRPYHRERVLERVTNLCRDLPVGSN